MSADSNRQWTAEDVLALGRSYQGAAVLAAGADLDVFSQLANRSRSAEELARAISADDRGLTLLLDALVALGLLSKSRDRYALPDQFKPLLTAEGEQSVLAMAQHQGNCLRRWAQLAEVVKTGRPPERTPSVRGEAADQQSFIGAMHNVSAPVAPEVIRGVQPLDFKHLLDVGGASGTWTVAFLQACAAGRATLFDLPEVIPMAERRLKAEGLAGRVTLVAGDYNVDEFPTGVDLAWVSAIVHQNSREQNRSLFARLARSLAPEGRIAIRDIVMEADRTHPVAGALFAINMLVATEGGGTFTLGELRDDLETSGFRDVTLARADQGMNAILVGKKGD